MTRDCPKSAALSRLGLWSKKHSGPNGRANQSTRDLSRARHEPRHEALSDSLSVALARVYGLFCGARDDSRANPRRAARDHEARGGRPTPYGGFRRVVCGREVVRANDPKHPLPQGSPYVDRTGPATSTATTLAGHPQEALYEPPEGFYGNAMRHPAGHQSGGSQSVPFPAS